MIPPKKYLEIPFAIGFLTTATYCALVWYLGNAFTILSPQEGLSLFSRFTAMPLELPLYFNMIHWQMLAGVSFVISLGTYCTSQASVSISSKPHPLLNHYGILFLFLLLNLTGFADAILDVAYTIG
jgi:hypothetical protein